jgi:hypothetical protein
LDKPTFVANLAFVKKRKILLYRIALGVLFVILATSMWLTKTHPGSTVMTAYRVGSTAVFGTLVFVFMSMVQRMNRAMGMHCPHCDRNLSGPAGRRAVETDTCAFCGNPLF